MPRRDAKAPAAKAGLWEEFYRGRSSKAREQLIEAYGYLVRATRSRTIPTLPPNVAMEDLYQAGHIGLIRAVDQFDPRRRCKFETYAIALIRVAMLEYLRRDDWAPRSVRDKEKNLNKVKTKLLERLGRRPTDDELAQAMGITLDQLYKDYGEPEAECMVSLEEPWADEEGGNDVTLAATLPSLAPEAQALLEKSCQEVVIREHVKSLPEREQTVVRLYYYEGLTFKQIGKTLLVSESRIFQIHGKAMSRMRNRIALDRDLFD